MDRHRTHSLPLRGYVTWLSLSTTPGTRVWREDTLKNATPFSPSLLSHTGAPQPSQTGLPQWREREGTQVGKRKGWLSFPQCPHTDCLWLAASKERQTTKIVPDKRSVGRQGRGFFFFLILVSCLLSLFSPSSFYWCTPGIVLFCTITIIIASHFSYSFYCHMSDPCRSAGSGRGKGSETRNLSVV